MTSCPIAIGAATGFDISRPVYGFALALFEFTLPRFIHLHLHQTSLKSRLHMTQ